MEEKKPDSDSSQKKEPKKYQEKLKVKGSFIDIIKASVNSANKKTAKKKDQH